jgi:hypothetical protein
LKEGEGATGALPSSCRLPEYILFLVLRTSPKHPEWNNKQVPSKRVGRNFSAPKWDAKFLGRFKGRKSTGEEELKSAL